MNFALSLPDLPVHVRFERTMNDCELLRFCAQNDDLRIERESNGEIVVMTPSGSRTSSRNAFLVHMLANWSDESGGGYYFDSNAGFSLPDGSMRSPDAAWVASARWEALSLADQERFAPVVPDFILELRSPSDPLPSLHAKMQQWIANGVKLAWLIDPIDQAVTIYRAGADPERLARPDAIQGTGPVDGFDLPLSKIWA